MNKHAEEKYLRHPDWYDSEAQEEKAISQSENYRGHTPRKFGQRLKDGFRLLDTDKGAI